MTTPESCVSSFWDDCVEKRPHSARVLGQWVDAYARERGLAPKRVRDWVSHMVLAGRLERANSESGEAMFTIKGTWPRATKTSRSGSRMTPT